MVLPIAILSIAVLTNSSTQVEEGRTDLATQRVKSLIAQLEDLQRSFRVVYEAAYRGGKSEEEKNRIQSEWDERRGMATLELMHAAKLVPWHPAAVEATIYALTKGEMGGTRDREEAFRLLIDPHESLTLEEVDHLQDERVADLCLALMRRDPFADVAAFLRAVVSRTENRRVRAYAIYALACRSHEMAGDIRESLNPPNASTNERNPEIHYTEAEAKRLAAEGDALFGQLIDEYADVPLSTDTLGAVAAAHLAAARVAVGRPAPEIEGIDAEGRPFKLSDYRGRVVLLSFWAGWCKPCIDLLPAERSLVERLEGKPFVLLGINSDETLDEFRKVNAAKQVPWRSWWDGPNDLISTGWGVRFFPSLYVIDRDGAIRSGRLSIKGAEELAERLLREE